MKLSSGKRIGQSGHELAAAAVFSLALHILAFGAAALFYTVTPKFHAPPYYTVKLVNLPAGADAAMPSGAEQPEPLKPEQKPQMKEKKARERKASAKGKNDGIPDLAKSKAKPETKNVEEMPEEASGKHAAAQSGAAGAKEGVAVAAATQQEFSKFAWYLDRIRNKISRNWNPPPDSKDAKVRVIFSINRSGWVGIVTLVEDESKGTFGFKQAGVRAVRSSNPFPALPDEFPKQSAEISVDLVASE